jgi:hypothetical protein
MAIDRVSKQDDKVPFPNEGTETPSVGISPVKVPETIEGEFTVGIEAETGPTQEPTSPPPQTSCI